MDWCKQRACINEPGPIHIWLAIEAACWGADQELDACCTWLSDHGYIAADPELRTARRPKPPSLKEQALEALKVIECEYVIGSTTGTIRKALEQLNDE